MAVTVSFCQRAVPLAACPPTLPAPAHFMCDTTAELPAGRAIGDTAYTRDNWKMWTYSGVAWEEIGGSAGAVWGAITGTLSSQSDLNTALAGKVATTRTVNGHALSADVTVTKTDVSLGNCDNTSDANKPVSTATQTALDGKQTLNSNLTTIAGLTATTDNFIVSAASAWASRTPAQAKTALALVKGDVGLGNVDNTTDANKPVSTATQTALNLKANLASPTFTGTVAGVTKAMVGLTNVDDTSDANKPVSTATQTALNAKEATANKGAASGYAGLDGSTKVPIAQLPTGTTATTVTIGNDARLSDARTPLAHATSHKSGGTDAIKLDELAAPTDVTTLDATTSAHGLMQKYPGGTTNFLRADGAFAAPTASIAAPFVGSQSPGSFTVATDQFGMQGKRLALTGAQRGTLEGTGRLILCG